jgi:manganese oxidase
VSTCALLMSSVALVADHSAGGERLPRIHINDNRTAAGQLRDGVLTLALRAGVGQWRPEGPGGPALTVEAFGEVTGALQVPAPLVRVTEGSRIVASVRNDLTEPLRVHGFCARDGSACEALDVPPETTREIQFVAARAGTYHYWATSTGAPLPFRGGPDTQLSGAFIVDPAGTTLANDRVIVLTEWTSLTRPQLKDITSATDIGAAFRALDPQSTFLVNGLSWPATERLTYNLGERIHWRVVNLSSQFHPMHLHGFYFQVESLGDGVRDTAIAAEQRPRVVTQLMPPGGTMAMTWQAERVGNWLFHCHIVDHVSPKRRLAEGSTEGDHSSPHRAHAGHNASAGMAAMVLGVTVIDSSSTDSRERIDPPARAITLAMRATPAPSGELTYGFAMQNDDHERTHEPVSVPGPTLVLRRGEPVEIALLNQLPEATAVHWHGIELDSYYDGVHGWSGVGPRVTPIIQPGASFLARMTPPRTGTFIYHTHLHDDRQLSAGLYGALLVVEPDEIFDPSTDHVVVISRGGNGVTDPVRLNGEQMPQMAWKAGGRHRLRFVNITPGDIFVTSLSTAEAPASWRPLTKDGAPVPTDLRSPQPATFTIAVGETYDFEYVAPAGRRGLWINVRTPGGRWEAQGRVVIK